MALYISLRNAAGVFVGTSGIRRISLQALRRRGGEAAVVSSSHYAITSQTTSNKSSFSSPPGFTTTTTSGNRLSWNMKRRNSTSTAISNNNNNNFIVNNNENKNENEKNDEEESSSSELFDNFTWIEIQSTDDGKGRGLFATRPIPIGTLVMRGRAIKTTSERDSHSIQIDWNKHVTMDEPAILVNHSCDYENKVNVGIKPNEYGAYDFYSIKNIEIGDEILWDYETSESQIDGFSKCLDCKYKQQHYCRGQLNGYLNSTAKDIILETYGKKHIAPYLFTKQQTQSSSSSSSNKQ